MRGRTEESDSGCSTTILVRPLARRDLASGCSIAVFDETLRRVSQEQCYIPLPKRWRKSVRSMLKSPFARYWSSGRVGASEVLYQLTYCGKSVE